MRFPSADSGNESVNVVFAERVLLRQFRRNPVAGVGSSHGLLPVGISVPEVVDEEQMIRISDVVRVSSRRTVELVAQVSSRVVAPWCCASGSPWSTLTGLVE